MLGGNFLQTDFIQGDKSCSTIEATELMPIKAFAFINKLRLPTVEARLQRNASRDDSEVAVAD